MPPLLMFLSVSLCVFLVPAHCPREWLAKMRSCYSVRTSALSWHDSQCSCKELAPGAHLADMKSWEDLLFVSSHLLTNDNLLLLWTGLNDQQVTSHSFGKHVWLCECVALQQTGDLFRVYPAFTQQLSWLQQPCEPKKDRAGSANR
uniref:C-type lectin domain-containing protein n=1 Tax=Oryzias latipes TaxID=8090 RepID=A0A3P9LQD8_ORYLA